MPRAAAMSGLPPNIEQGLQPHPHYALREAQSRQDCLFGGFKPYAGSYKTTSQALQPKVLKYESWTLFSVSSAVGDLLNCLRRTNPKIIHQIISDFHLNLHLSGDG
jgi:hypothetical protein